MAGIYIHFPFCRRACHYCDFHFTTNLERKEELVSAILRETELRKEYLQNEEVTTIYFGGGTPSLLPTHSIASILTKIHRTLNVNPQAEITLEANPEDLSEEKLKEIRSIGVNRLSLGTQSFINSELKWMNRMHTAEQAVKCIEDAQNIGFNNISIDLIFGLPDQSFADWEYNLDRATSLQIQHVSSYSLTVEEKTVLNRRIQKGTQKRPNEDLAANFLEMNMSYFPQHGFEQYEISNFALDGFISKHNSSYWQGVNYLGLGPSAHSFNGTSRQWNVRSNAAYMNTIEKGGSFFEVEKLSVIDRLNEHILTSLRTKWGIRKNVMEGIEPDSWSKLKSRVTSSYQDHLHIEDNRITLTASGKLLADSITSDLFF